MTTPRAIARRLQAAGCVFAEDEADLLFGSVSAPDLADAVRRRVGGEPLEYVLGWASFAGRRVGVTPGVFVPRRRSELLARLAVARARPGEIVVELCCGTGAVSVVLADEVTGLDLHLVDVDPVAVACARDNLGARAAVHLGNLFEGLPSALRGRVDLVVANAPYVPTDAIATMPPEARLYEARVALDGGADGLDLHRRIADSAPAWLSAAGSVLIETSRSQAHQTADALRRNGFTTATHHDDELDGTVVEAATARHDQTAAQSRSRNSSESSSSTIGPSSKSSNW